MDRATAVDLLGTRRQISTQGHVMSLKEIVVVLSRRRGFWLLLVAALIVSAAALLSSIYWIQSLMSLRRALSTGFPIPNSAVKEQLNALHLTSPWHDQGVEGSRVCNTSDCVHAAYHLLFGINHAANPCDDFYEFSCGNWIKLYKDHGLEYYRHTDELATFENAQLKEILKQPPDSFEFAPVKAAATFFHQCIKADNVSTVVELTAKLGGWPSLEGENWNEDGFDLETALAFIHRRYDLPIFMGVNLTIHGDNETVYAMQLNAPAFTPEDKLRNETTMAAFKSLYSKILSELTGLRDWSGQEAKDADEISELENALALAVTIPDEHANVTNTTDTFTVAEFLEYLNESLNKPISNYSISWKRLFNEIFSTSAVEINDDQVLIVADLGYFSRMTQILDATPRRTIANYVLSSLALELLPEASRKMERMIKEFSVQIGQQVDLQPRENYCFVYTVAFLHVPVMHEYLKAKSNHEARAIVEEMTAIIRARFPQLLQSNNWLSDAAKLTVQKKLETLKTFIGYPNWLLNTTEIESIFEGLHTGSNFIETYGNVMQWTNENVFRQLGQSPGRLEEPWFDVHELGDATFSVFQEYDLMLPSGVGAFHNQFYNHLIITMGFIQPHYFYNNVPSYVNYGKIGAAIGHEIIHGFDPSNKNFDENGQFDNQSWTDEDEQNYEEKSNCFRDQYNKFEIFPGVYLNGSGGLNENIADNNGLKLAYLTYKEEFARTSNDQQSLPGFEKLSMDQLFFLSYGSQWCDHEDEATQQYLVEEDPHSTAKYRINGVLQNSPEFADAWNCPAGVPMNPINKCALW